MLRSPSIPVEANHNIEYLRYFLYLVLSTSTPFDAFLTGLDVLMLPLMGSDLTGKLYGFEFRTGGTMKLSHELTKLFCEHF